MPLPAFEFSTGAPFGFVFADRHIEHPEDEFLVLPVVVKAHAVIDGEVIKNIEEINQAGARGLVEFKPEAE